METRPEMDRLAKQPLLRLSRNIFGALLLLISGFHFGAHANDSTTASECIDWATKRVQLGREDKYRILVDKVWSRSNDWVLTEEHFREIREAGYNVVSPRMGADDTERVRRDAAMAAENGLFYMAWMRGTKKPASGPKLVWEQGLVQNLCSPNSDELWGWLTNEILQHVRLSAEHPSFIGTFLDFENYEPDFPQIDRPHCYPISYDEKILAEFAASEAIEIPDVSPQARAPWLNERGLHEDFREFQIESWRQRCRDLRLRIDEINPDFQLIIYPPMGTDFIEEAVYPEWGTVKAPIILAEYWTYGRRGWIDHAEALKKNRHTLVERMAFVRNRGVHHHYLGGVDPMVTGADPEFTGKNAAMIAEISDGYWNFYEGPTLGQEDHAAYLDWLEKANADIASGSYELYWRPRETPDLRSTAVVFDPEDGRKKIAQWGLDWMIHHQIYLTGKNRSYALKGPAFDHMKQFDAVILNDYRLPTDDPFTQDLRTYVENGGGLLLLEDMAWEFAKLFPEIAGTPESREELEEGRYALCDNLSVRDGFAPFDSLESKGELNLSVPRHVVLQAGPDGKVLMENCFSDPVCIVGDVGKGRVAFFGADYGKESGVALDGREHDLFMALLGWVAADLPLPIKSEGNTE